MYINMQQVKLFCGEMLICYCGLRIRDWGLRIWDCGLGYERVEEMENKS